MKNIAALFITPLMVILALSAMAGCGSGTGGTKGGSGGRIEGIDWVLQAYKDEGAMSDLPEEVRIDALFEGGKVSGSSGINTYSATYEISSPRLTVGQVTGTKMAGPEAVMAIEQAYLAALQKASSYTATEDSLTVYDADGGELLAYVKEEAPSLTGVTWSATAYNDGKEAVVSPIAGSELTALFSEDGTVSGSSGVNTFSGSYKVEGGNIAIGPLATTLIASEDAALMEQEAAYLAALQSASAYSVRGGKLELRREDDALAVTYTVKR